MNADALIQPFVGLRPPPQQVARVSAPPYDVMNTAEARDMARGNPDSFLNVSRAEINLEPGISLYDARVYQESARQFRRMRDAGVLVADPQPCYY
ncbi:MAG: DUF1015 domain-containing protein, partial [Magnetococcus sp. WYHC-3]